MWRQTSATKRAQLSLLEREGNQLSCISRHGLLPSSPLRACQIFYCRVVQNAGAESGEQIVLALLFLLFIQPFMPASPSSPINLL